MKSQDLVEKRRKKAQCVWNWCKDLFKRKKKLGVRCTLKSECEATHYIGISRGLERGISSLLWEVGIFSVVTMHFVHVGLHN